jgi:hypothetical protein
MPAPPVNELNAVFPEQKFRDVVAARRNLSAHPYLENNSWLARDKNTSTCIFTA